MNKQTYSFDLAPHETMHRSKLDLSHSVKSSFNVGELIPLYTDPDILPGDTFSVKTSSVVRLQTLLDPIMDDVVAETFWFFVPHRLVWEHWKEFMGENKTTPWTPTVTYTIPQIIAPSGGWNVGTIADYMSLPISVGNISCNALPFRAYALTCSEWFRRQAVTYPVNCPTDDTTITGVNTGDQVTDIVKGGQPFKVAKWMDYFTAALPAPQQGNDVLLPLGELAPVYTGDDNAAPVSKIPIHFMGTSADLSLPGSTSYPLFGYHSNATDKFVISELSSSSSSGISKSVYPSNLYADLSLATGSSVNQLRTAFQLQKFAERTARSGNRYTEYIRAAFGTISPDARQQRPEYLGGSRWTLNVKSVAQTSATGTTGTPQGHTAAYSVSTDSHGDFSKSFTEHGTLMCLLALRYKHTYCQGIPKGFLRKNRVDFYDPLFANLGEMAIYNSQIYAQGSGQVDPSTGKPYDDGVFGYNEAWAEYRFKHNQVTGQMRPTAITNLATWHLADKYTALPSLSDTWMREDKSNVDRVLAVTSSVANQCFGDFYFDIKATRVMPVYSIPGLIDHH